jgi:SAM-dependent methyltransferase
MFFGSGERMKLLAGGILKRWILAFLYPRPLIGLIYLPRFFNHWLRYAGADGAEKISVLDLHPCLGDWSTHTPFDAHYFYQGAWLARRISSANVARHVDVGSSVLTVSVLSAHVETIFVDYRPLKATLSGLTSIAGNILDLPFTDDSVESLSCLHVIEHIGLGRYGDPIDPLGSVKAALELQRIVRSGGKLCLSLPVGRERICFNAHRVHAPSSVLRMFSQMNLVEFSYVDDDGQYHEGMPVEAANNLEYGCGLFQLEKL